MESLRDEEVKHESLAPKAYHLYLKSTAKDKIDKLMEEHHGRGKR